MVFEKERKKKKTTQHLKMRLFHSWHEETRAWEKGYKPSIGAMFAYLVSLSPTKPPFLTHACSIRTVLNHTKFLLAHVMH